MLTCIDDNRTCLNDSINTTVQYYDHIPYSVRPETYIVPALFVVIFLVGLIGNGTLIWMFFWNDDMHSVSNIFLMCLSVGDMIVILFTVPFVGTIYIFESWPYGEFVCKMSEFLCDLSEGVTILSLTVLSVDRYMVVSTPLRKQQTYHSKLLIIVVAMVIWVISIGLAIPGAYFSFIYKLAGSGKIIKICYPFPSQLGHWYPRAIVLCKFVLLYALPLVIISVFYVLTAQHLLLSTKERVVKNVNHIRQLKARKKVAWTVLSLVGIFCICFFPSHLFMLWFYFHPDSLEAYNDFWHAWKITGYILIFANSCLNPIAIYCVSNVFRNYFHHYLFCCRHGDTHRQCPLTHQTVFLPLRYTRNSAITRV